MTASKHQADLHASYAAWRITYQSSEQAARAAYARVQELEAQLEAIGAGGVEPLRRRECLHHIAPQQDDQKPYAYAVYFPDQPTVELVHDLDELTDDLTNREHQITRLYAAPQPAPAAQGDAEDAARWRVINEQFIDDYLEDYELVGEAEGVGDCSYTPTETERDLIKDAILGLLSCAEDAARSQAKEGGA